MADLFVLGFPTKEKAEAVMEVSRDLQKQELLDLEDAALVWRTADGKIKVQQGYSTVAAGAAGGALWGMLFGLIFLMPVFGLAIGAASGALAGKLTDLGIDDKFMKEVAATLTPGAAAVFALVRRQHPGSRAGGSAPLPADHRPDLAVGQGGVGTDQATAGGPGSGAGPGPGPGAASGRLSRRNR